MSATAASSSSAGKRRRSSDSLLLIAALIAACKGQPQAAPSTTAAVRYPVPVSADRGRLCADIRDKRVCWRGATVELGERELPSVPAPPRGFRCGGSEDERVCEDRARNGSAFDCGTTRCLQERPRMPDDGEWECVELSGVAYCRSRGPVAGMHTGPMDLGWLCGPRRGGGNGEHICVDLDPDRPPLATHRRCRYELHHGVQQRSCTAATELIAGDPCLGGSLQCPSGTQCERAVDLCLPARPEPACWLDGDCGAGARCVLGTCAKAEG